MNLTEIYSGARVLVQSGAEVKEHADVVKKLENGKVLCKMSDFEIREIEPQYILKIFK